MSLLSWPALLKAQPTPHLVVAVVTHVGADEAGTLHLREIRRLLVRVISELAPGCDVALTLSRARGFPEIHCGFAREDDARALAAVLQATPFGRHAGCAGQWTASFDAAREAALAER